MSLSILVVVHADEAPAGLLRSEAERLGHRLRYAYVRNTEESDAFAAELREDHQDAIRCDALVILGGPMSSCDEQQFPHYGELLALIRAYASAGRAILGLCLGAQLIARAFGASVAPMGFFEARCEPLSLTVAGQRDRLLRDLPRPLKPMQWHYDTFEIPRDAVALVEGSRCLNQGFFIEPGCWGFQAHFEATATTCISWDHELCEQAGGGVHSGPGLSMSDIENAVKNGSEMMRRWFFEAARLAGRSDDGA